MTKLILLSIFVLTLIGCNQNKRSIKTIDLDIIRKRCFGGVVYYRYDTGITPAFNRDGTLKLCSMKKNNY